MSGGCGSGAAVLMRLLRAAFSAHLRDELSVVQLFQSFSGQMDADIGKPVRQEGVGRRVTVPLSDASSGGLPEDQQLFMSACTLWGGKGQLTDDQTQLLDGQDLEQLLMGRCLVAATWASTGRPRPWLQYTDSHDVSGRGVGAPGSR